MKKNSILFLTNAYPDFDSSYRGIFIKNMAHLLEKDGYRITVVTPKIFKTSPVSEKQGSMKIYRFPFFSGNKLLIEYKKIPYFRMMLYFLSGIFNGLYAALRNRCDLIHTHWAVPTGLIGVVIGAVLRKPLIVTVHGSDLRLATEKSRLLRKLFLFVCHKALHINCVSTVQKQEIENLGIAGAKISVFPMGIDESFLRGGKTRGKKPDDKGYTILSNRNLLPIYNVSSLIKAIPLVLTKEPKARFLIAGDGPEKETLEKKARDLNVISSIQFLGRIPHEEMPDLLARADIYVSASLHDGTSVSLLEAMGAGTFPIVTDIDANREWIVNGGNGFLVAVNEERILAEKIIDAIRNPALLEKSRLENPGFIEKRAVWPTIIKEVKEIYRQSFCLIR